MNKWRYLPCDLWFFKWKALGASSPLADFGRLRTSSEDFGNLRKWSCRLQKSQHSQDKNLTLISQKKLAGIELSTKCFTLHMHAKPWSPNINMCILSIVFSVFPTKLFQRISFVIFHSFVHSFITCLFDEAVKLWGEFNNGVYWGTGSLNAVLPIS